MPEQVHNIETITMHTNTVQFSFCYLFTYIGIFFYCIGALRISLIRAIQVPINVSFSVSLFTKHIVI